MQLSHGQTTICQFSPFSHLRSIPASCYDIETIDAESRQVLQVTMPDPRCMRFARRFWDTISLTFLSVSRLKSESK